MPLVLEIELRFQTHFHGFTLMLMEVIGFRWFLDTNSNVFLDFHWFWKQAESFSAKTVYLPMPLVWLPKHACAQVYAH